MKRRAKLINYFKNIFHDIRDVREALAPFPLGRNESAECLVGEGRVNQLAGIVKSLPKAQRQRVLSHASQARGQLLQDLYVIAELGDAPGFFVEFGATDGIALSNTWLLENRLGWRGILAEPGRCWQSSLRKNRTALIETDCVWSQTGQMLEFSESPIAEYSTLSEFKSVDEHAAQRAKSETYKVSTVSLVDLMRRHNAPANPDYLSIDTEGSELSILSAFDFERYPFKVITCEHNYTPKREAIYQLLTAAGYHRKHEQLSQFDDWYVRRK